MIRRKPTGSRSIGARFRTRQRCEALNCDCCVAVDRRMVFRRIRRQRRVWRQRSEIRRLRTSAEIRPHQQIQSTHTTISLRARDTQRPDQTTYQYKQSAIVSCLINNITTERARTLTLPLKLAKSYSPTTWNENLLRPVSHAAKNCSHITNFCLPDQNSSLLDLGPQPRSVVLAFHRGLTPTAF